jgi:hypothetical protein
MPYKASGQHRHMTRAQNDSTKLALKATTNGLVHPLTMDTAEQQALAQLRALTNGCDDEAAINVLASVDWDVQVCLSTLGLYHIIEDLSTRGPPILSLIPTRHRTDRVSPRIASNHRLMPQVKVKIPLVGSGYAFHILECYKAFDSANSSPVTNVTLASYILWKSFVFCHFTAFSHTQYTPSGHFRFLSSSIPSAAFYQLKSLSPYSWLGSRRD